MKANHIHQVGTTGAAGTWLSGRNQEYIRNSLMVYISLLASFFHVEISRTQIKYSERWTIVSYLSE